MDFALYSLGIVLGFAIVRWLTENMKFHIRTNSIWLHHWIIALLVMLPLFYFQVDEPLLWGGLTGTVSRRTWKKELVYSSIKLLILQANCLCSASSKKDWGSYVELCKRRCSRSGHRQQSVQFDGGSVLGFDTSQYDV